MQQRQHASPEPEACGMGHNATVTLEPEPSNIYQPKSPCPSSSTTSSPDTSQAMTAMVRPLGRTRTLARIEIADSSVNTPVLAISGVMAPSPSILQHRENSAIMDVDDQHHGKAPCTDEDDDLQTTVGPQQISKPQSQTLDVQQPALSTRRAPTSRPARTKPVAARTIAPRFPSPASTVPEDPDPEYIFNQLAKHHIKIRDFAQCPPYTTGASLPNDSVCTPAFAPPYCENLSKIVHPISSARMPPETFDPYKALGEFEFRLRQRPRILPIGGKTLRRLIEIGWVTENEVESRCSEKDLESLEKFDSRNHMRLLKLTALREQREREFGTTTSTSVLIVPVVSNNETVEPGIGLPINEGYTSTGAYPYVTLPSETVPTFAEREVLIRSLRPHFNVTDRVIRMGLAMERERERDRLEAEEALIRMGREDEAERKRVECEVLLPNAEMDEDLSDGNALTTGPVTPTVLQPAAEIMLLSPRAANPRKRSPQVAWADEENHRKDNNDELEPKRSRLARSQSETWYEQQRRQQQSPSKDNHPRPHSHSPRKGVTVSFETRNNSNLQSQSQQTHPRCQSRNQTSPFTPPEIQYPAPLSTYDPNLYPDAASAIEAQSQQSESQGRRHPHSYRPGTDTPPASDDEGDGDEKKGIMIGRGFGLTEDGEPDMNRPNALKRGSKKGVQRELTRGRTLVQIF